MFTAYFCRVCGKTQSILTGYCNHEKESFKMTEEEMYERMNIDYPTRRNVMLGVRRLAAWCFIGLTILGVLYYAV